MKNMVITKDKYTMNLAAFRFPPFRKKVFEFFGMFGEFSLRLSSNLRFIKFCIIVNQEIVWSHFIKVQFVTDVIIG